MNLLQRLTTFIERDLWRIRLAGLPRYRSVALRILRVIILSMREFDRDKCVLRASALTFYTLLSIVPVLAMAFGIAKGFGFQEHLEAVLRRKMQVGTERPAGASVAFQGATGKQAGSPHHKGTEVDGVFQGAMGAEGTGGTPVLPSDAGERSVPPSRPPVTPEALQQEVFDRVIVFANNLLDQTKGGVVAGIGVVVLLWTVIKVLSHIERSFNDIWGVSKSRSLGRKFSDYLAFVVISPVLFVLSSSLTVLVAGEVRALVRQIEILGGLGSVILLSLELIPLALLWALFTFTYLFMPNTRVRMSSGILAGIVAGALCQAVQWVYIHFQVGVSKYNAIYGSFAALPLFLLWLQTSWLIVLYGAELAFAHQNVDTYEFEPDCHKVRPAFRQFVELAATWLCVRSFQRGDKAPSAPEIARELEAPIRLVNQVLFDLTEAGVLSEVTRGQGRLVGYHPAKDIETTTVQEVLNRLADLGGDDLPLAMSPPLSRLADSLRDLRRLCEDAPGNLKIKDL